MNYLAHALLAEPHAYSLIGNVAGDLVKGRLDSHALHPRVAEGVRRHRRVDALTDAHPRYRALKSLFPQQQRRSAPIVLDVLFDHYLTRDWNGLSGLDRGGFIDGVYDILTRPDAPLPAALGERVPQWVAADWLRVYASLEGVEAVLARLALRSRRSLPLTETLATARACDAQLCAGFHAVFCDVRSALDGLAPPFDACASGRSLSSSAHAR